MKTCCYVLSKIILIKLLLFLNQQAVVMQVKLKDILCKEHYLCAILRINVNLTKIQFLQPTIFNSIAFDLCTIENGGCEHNCVNTDDSYYCTCNDGYILSNGNACPGKEFITVINTYNNHISKMFHLIHIFHFACDVFCYCHIRRNLDCFF